MDIKTKIEKKLLQAKKVLIICHVNPDGDTVWSSVALACFLKQRKISAKIISFDPIPENIALLSDHYSIDNNLPVKWKPDLVVAMECGSSKRTGFDIAVDINIDHHFDNTRYGKINWVDKDASSAGSMIFQLAKKLKFKIAGKTAKLLYAAIYSDTGGFRFANTSAQTFREVQELVEKGASPELISQIIDENISQEDLKLLGKILLDLKTENNGKIIYSFIRKNSFQKKGTKIIEPGVRIIDFLRMQKNSEVAVVFKEHDKKLIKVSLRSKGSLDVRAIAAKYQGGGHKKAAGCTFNTELGSAIKAVIADVKKALNKGKK
jgi:bifunctional oligoribonuclease and PAP phosphatase NrnA